MTRFYLMAITLAAPLLAGCFSPAPQPDRAFRGTRRNTGLLKWEEPIELLSPSKGGEEQTEIREE